MADEQEQDKLAEAKRKIAAVYGRAAPTFDRVGPRYFGHFGRRLVERAGLQAGEHVLDVACGRGAALLPASEAVGEDGHAIGIDLSVGMIRALANDLHEQHRTNTGVCIMDAERLEFPDDSFDCVLCGFALFFFPQLELALSEMRRVLKPGGRIAVTTWDKAGDADWQWYDNLVQSYLPAQRTPENGGAQRPLLGEPQGVREILSAARFRDVQVSTETFESSYRSEEEWWDVLWSHGARTNLETIAAERGAAVLERLKADAFRGLQKMKRPDGFHCVWTAICAVGWK